MVRVPSDGPHVDEEPGFGRDMEISHGAVLGRFSDYDWASWVEPEGLFDDHLEVGKIGDVGFLD